MISHRSSILYNFIDRERLYISLFVDVALVSLEHDRFATLARVASRGRPRVLVRGRSVVRVRRHDDGRCGLGASKQRRERRNVHHSLVELRQERNVTEPGARLDAVHALEAVRIFRSHFNRSQTEDLLAPTNDTALRRISCTKNMNGHIKSECTNINGIHVQSCS